MKRPKLCGGCGSKDIKIINLKGRTFPFKNFSAVELTKDIKAPTCESCGEIFLQLGKGEDFDYLLLESIKDKTSEYIITLLRNTGMAQKELSTILDVSEAYLSDLKNKKKDKPVGKSLFNLIKLLVNDPARVHELDKDAKRSFWRSRYSYNPEPCKSSDYVTIKTYKGLDHFSFRTQPESDFDSEEVLAA